MLRYRGVRDGSMSLVMADVPFSGRCRCAPACGSFKRGRSGSGFFRRVSCLAPRLVHVLGPNQLTYVRIGSHILFNGTAKSNVPAVSPFDRVAMFRCVGRNFQCVKHVAISASIIERGGRACHLNCARVYGSNSGVKVKYPRCMLLFHGLPASASHTCTSRPIAGSGDRCSLTH